MIIHRDPRPNTRRRLPRRYVGGALGQEGYLPALGWASHSHLGFSLKITPRTQPTTWHGGGGGAVVRLRTRASSRSSASCTRWSPTPTLTTTLPGRATHHPERRALRLGAPAAVLQAQQPLVVRAAAQHVRLLQNRPRRRSLHLLAPRLPPRLSREACSHPAQPNGAKGWARTVQLVVPCAPRGL